MRVDGELCEITPGMKVDRYKNHDIELVVDRFRVSGKSDERLRDTVDAALRYGDKELMIFDVDDCKVFHYSQQLMDPVTGLSYSEPAPHNFSFNSPQGACPCCKGLGFVNIVDREKIIPDARLSIAKGGIAPLGKYRDILIFKQIAAICAKHGFSIDTPIADLDEAVLSDILNGTPERLDIEGETSSYFSTYEGLVKYIEMQQADEATASAQKWSGQFYSRKVCPECNGDRLNRQALNFFIDGQNIAQLARLDIADLFEWSKTILDRLGAQERKIAAEILEGVNHSLSFLVDVGLI